MKKIILSVAVLIASTIKLNAQVGVGVTTPDPSSLLEVKSTTQGMLTPRMTSTQRGSISTPATGLIVYQTDDNPGFYYYTGSACAASLTRCLPSGFGSSSAPPPARAQSSRAAAPRQAGPAR